MDLINMVTEAVLIERNREKKKFLCILKTKCLLQQTSGDNTADKFGNTQ